MYRKRLRTTAGCQRCRTRRVKCDEQHPICIRCQRWGKECRWGAKDSIREVTRSVATKTILLGDMKMLTVKSSNVECFVPKCVRTVSSGYEPFEDQNQLKSTLCSVPVILQFINPIARPYFSDLSVLSALTLQEESVRHAILAFGSLTNDRRQEVGLVPGVANYAKACVKWRERFSSRLLSWDSDIPAFIVLAYLGSIEVSGKAFYYSQCAILTQCYRVVSMDPLF